LELHKVFQKREKGLSPGNVERFANGSTNNNNSNPDIDFIKKKSDYCC